jgi:hypothetical protein
LALYVGFYHATEEFVRSEREKVVSGERQSESETSPPWPERFQERLRGFPAFLESRGVELTASYTPVGFGTGANPSQGRPPGLLIVETDSEEDLAAINAYYFGYVTFSFYRYNRLERGQ